MSKFFYKGSRVNMQDTRGTGYNPNKTIRVGTEKNPAQVTVATAEREAEVLARAAEHGVVLNVVIDDQQAEDLRQLEAVINTAPTQVRSVVPARNEPCLCGSGKKYKKCCGA